MTSNTILDCPLAENEMKLRGKYTCTTPYKFGGKKNKKSNEGRVGRVHRRTLRCLVSACSNSKKRR